MKTCHFRAESGQKLPESVFRMIKNSYTRKLSRALGISTFLQWGRERKTSPVSLEQQRGPGSIGSRLGDRTAPSLSSPTSSPLWSTRASSSRPVAFPLFSWGQIRSMEVMDKLVQGAHNILVLTPEVEIHRLGS